MQTLHPPIPSVDAKPPVYRVGTLSYTKPALVVLFCWLLWGDFCFALMEGVIPSVMPLKFKALGASNSAIGLILGTIPALIGSVFTPIISFRSDRYRSRWGRRLPFIISTMPILVICLVTLGFADRIGFWLHGRFATVLGGFSPTTVAICAMAVCLTLFAFFDTFVNSVFWYLFNDVVPENMLARFMSWFRMVSMAALAFYNLFIFRYADTHSTSILVGAAIVYLVGFGLMCLNIREGEYPPPPRNMDGQRGLMAAIKTYACECLSLPHYWYVFLMGMCMGAIYSSNLFMLFFYQSTGLDLAQVGKVNLTANIAAFVTFPVAGWLADRFHPIRVVIAAAILQVVVATPATLLWLAYQPSPQMAFYVWIAMTALLIAPAFALIKVTDPPLFMRIFPRDRYGQFCSANAMLRALAMIIGGGVVGKCLDVLTGHFGSRAAYCSLPFWVLLWYSAFLFFVSRLYRSWRAHGGDGNYIAPYPGKGSVS